MGAVKATEPAKAQASPKSVPAQARAASLTPSEPIGNAALGRLLRTRVSAPRIQRACACGGHTASGGNCLDCEEKRLGLQTKLLVNEPGDRYEQEAERVADEVMTMPARSTVTATPSHVERLSRESSAHVDAPSAGPTSAPPIVRDGLSSPGQPLPSSARTFFEPRFGADFSQVRLHTDAAAQQSARDINAKAYTVGPNIVFGSGRFAPETQEGQRLLAHELTHVVQQSSARDTNSEREVQRAPQGIVQRQMCTGVLNAEEVPGVTRGVEVERAVRADLIDQLGAQNIVQGLTIPGASSRDYRMEECGGFQTTRPPRQGYPDLAFRQYPGGRTVELAEVKIGTWPCLALAEIQVDRYVKLADGNAAYKQDLGVDHFEAMPTSRFTPTQLRDPVSGTDIDVAWCSPGVIVYKAVAENEEEEEEPEDEEPKDNEPKDNAPDPGDSLPEKLAELAWPLLTKGLAAAGLLDIGMALAGVLGSFVSSPLVALAAVVLGIAFFWDEIKWLGSKIAGMAGWVWDKIAGLADWVLGKFEWIVGKLYELGIKLAELGSWLAGKIAWLGEKLAEGLTWIAGKIGAGAWWLGGKIASAAEAIWDWLWGSDVEAMVPNLDIPMPYEPTRHCRTVAYEDTIVRLPADLLFAPDEFTLTPEADDVLKEAAAKIGAMIQKDDWIRFEGYADNTLDEAHNQRLSLQRAKAVASWFVEHGIVPWSSVRTEGYGETMAQGHDKETRKKDRRVDIWLPKHSGVETQCWDQ